MRPAAALLAAAALTATASARAEGPHHQLAFNGYADVSLTVAFAAYMGVAELGLKSYLVSLSPLWSDRDPDGNEALNPVDRAAYKALRWKTKTEVAGRISDIALLFSTLAPLGVNVAAARLHGDGAADIGANSVIILETTLMTMVLMETTKFLAGRQRPCAYYAPHVQSEPAGAVGPCGADRYDENLSSFSGHTAVTAASWGSSAMVASMRGYSLAPLLWGAGALFTLSTGYLRIAANKHYLTDVLVGGVVGATTGMLMPYVFHGRINEAAVLRPSQLPAPPAATTLSFSGTF